MHFALTQIFPLAAMVVDPAMSMLDEFGVGLAIALTVAGVTMHWRLPRQRMSIEERVKDGKLSEEAAQRWIKIYGWCAPTATVLGVLVLVLTMLGVMN
jgi:hypothetical protein